MRPKIRYESLESRQLLTINPTSVTPMLLRDIGANVSTGIVTSPNGSVRVDASAIDMAANSSDIQEFFEYNGEVFFRANNGTNGSELWKTDGTPAGTVMVKDINPAGSSVPAQFTEANGLLFFIADGASGTGLWRSDGTTAGTTLVDELNFTELIPQQNGILGELNGELIYAVGDQSSSSTEKYNLWKTDGTQAGTSLLKAFDGTGGYYGVVGRLIHEFNGEIFFEAREPATGFEVWKTDGTAAGTQIAFDLNPGRFSSNPVKAVDTNGSLYFIADTWSDETESLWPSLFKSDGTAAGTEQLTRHGLAVHRFTGLLAHDGEVYYSLAGGASIAAPYRTDGTTNGTVRLAPASNVDRSFVGDFDVALDQVVMLWLDTVIDGDRHGTLWISDGSEDGAVQLTDSAIPTNGGLRFVERDGQIYYPTYGPEHDTLFDSFARSDGTPDDTVVLPDAGDGWAFVQPKDLLDDGRILMVGWTRSTGREHWIFDPDTETYEVLEIAPGDFSAVRDGFAAPFQYNGSYLVVAAGSDRQGEELWMLKVDSSEQKPGDITGDGSVNFSDFLILSQNFGKVDAAFADGDLDRDGTVGFADFLLVSQNFGT